MSKYITRDFPEVTFDDNTVQQLHRLLEAMDGCNYNIDYENHGIWLTAKEEEAELRLHTLSNIKLTVSRVCFHHKRAGIMTAVFEILKSFCRQNSVGKIVIESVLTQEMSSWCEKNGFVPDPYSSMQYQGYITGNWNYDVNT